MSSASTPVARAAPAPPDDDPGADGLRWTRPLEGPKAPGPPNKTEAPAAGAPVTPPGPWTWITISDPTPLAPPLVAPVAAPAPSVAAPAALPAPAPGGGGQSVGLLTALSLGTVAAAAFWWHVAGRYWRAERRRVRRGLAAGACRVCGYCLTGNASGVCPECGTTTGRHRQSVLRAPTRRPGRRSGT